MIDSDDGQPLALPPLAARAPDPGHGVCLPWSMRCREAFGHYLPVLLMAILAGASWWLVRHTPEAQGPQAEKVLRHEPDYEMHGFSVQHYTEAGPARGVLSGQRLRHYPDTEELLIDAVQLRWEDEQGHLMHAQAASAVASDDARQVRLQGNAIVRREAVPGVSRPMEFTGERIDFDADAATARSDQPVLLREGDATLRASGLYYSHRDATVELTGGVKGVVPARTGRAP